MRISCGPGIQSGVFATQPGLLGLAQLVHAHRVRHSKRQRSASSIVVAAAARKGKKIKKGGGNTHKGSSNKPSQGVAAAKLPKKNETALLESQTLTGPLKVQTLEQLTSVESQPAPLWDTFCGAIGGCWQGTMAAFHPDTGKPEEVALNAQGGKLFDMQTILVADRLEDGNIQRRFQMAETKDELQLRGDDSSASDDWDLDVIQEEEEGLVVFDGGSYSRGPLRLGVLDASRDSSRRFSDDFYSSGPNSAESRTLEAGRSGNGSSSVDVESRRTDDNSSALDTSREALDEESDLQTDDSEGLSADEPVPSQTVVIEQCIAWGGELRVRMQITLAIAELWEGEELDLEVLRVAVFREAWECLTDDAACSLQDMISPLSSSPAISKKAMIGEYKVFDLSAIPVDETDPFTGETKQLMLHYSQETQQSWAAPEAAPDDGAALWLPGQLLLQLRMMPAATRGTEADASEGVDLAAPCGLLLSAGWAASGGVMSLVEREYDGTGYLSEVRARTAVRGRM